jgi:hypothetical protein
MIRRLVLTWRLYRDLGLEFSLARAWRTARRFN